MDPVDALPGDIGEAFRRASPTNRLNAVVLACEQAVAHSKLPQEEEIVSQALALLRARTPPEPTLGERLNAMAAAYDDAYLDLDEAAEESGDASRKADGQRLCRKARAASALACALEGKLGDAIYEAAHATDNQDDLLRSAADALRG